MQHYLLTGYLSAGHVHGYLAMPGDSRMLMSARVRMQDATRGSSDPLAFVFLETQLTSKVDVVREIITRRCEEARKLMNVPEGVFVLFTLSDNDPDDMTLMGIH